MVSGLPGTAGAGAAACVSAAAKVCFYGARSGMACRGERRQGKKAKGKGFATGLELCVVTGWLKLERFTAFCW